MLILTSLSCKSKLPHADGQSSFPWLRKSMSCGFHSSKQFPRKLCIRGTSKGAVATVGRPVELMVLSSVGVDMLEEACWNRKGETWRALLMFAANGPVEVMVPVVFSAIRPCSEPSDDLRLSKSPCRAEILSPSSRAGMLPSSTIEWSNVKANAIASSSSALGRSALDIIRTTVAENV